MVPRPNTNTAGDDCLEKAIRGEVAHLRLYVNAWCEGLDRLFAQHSGSVPYQQPSPSTNASMEPGCFPSDTSPDSHQALNSASLNSSTFNFSATAGGAGTTQLNSCCTEAVLNLLGSVNTPAPSTDTNFSITAAIEVEEECESEEHSKSLLAGLIPPGNAVGPVSSHLGSTRAIKSEPTLTPEPSRDVNSVAESDPGTIRLASIQSSPQCSNINPESQSPTAAAYALSCQNLRKRSLASISPGSVPTFGCTKPCCVPSQSKLIKTIASDGEDASATSANLNLLMNMPQQLESLPQPSYSSNNINNNDNTRSPVNKQASVVSCACHQRHTIGCVHTSLNNVPSTSIGNGNVQAIIPPTDDSNINYSNQNNPSTTNSTNTHLNQINTVNNNISINNNNSNNTNDNFGSFKNASSNVYPRQGQSGDNGMSEMGVISAAISAVLSEGGQTSTTNTNDSGKCPFEIHYNMESDSNAISAFNSQQVSMEPSTSKPTALQPPVAGEMEITCNICPICNKSFKDKSNVRRHVDAVHLRRKPHYCPHCTEAFGSQDSMDRHIDLKHNSLHTPQQQQQQQQQPQGKRKTHHCPTCNLGFVRKDALTRHIDDKHLKQNLLFYCPDCNMGFTCKQDLVDHTGTSWCTRAAMRNNGATASSTAAATSMLQSPTSANPGSGTHSPATPNHTVTSSIGFDPSRDFMYIQPLPPGDPLNHPNGTASTNDHFMAGGPDQQTVSNFTGPHLGGSDATFMNGDHISTGIKTELPDGVSGEQQEGANGTDTPTGKRFHNRGLCPICNKQFGNISQHINDVHAPRKLFKCDKCSYLSPRKSNVERHNYQCHTTALPPPDADTVTKEEVAEELMKE